MDRPADDLPEFEMLDDASVEAMRRLGGQGRLRMMDELCRMGRELMARRVRDQHPDWTDDQVSTEVARRIRDAAA